MMKAATIDQIEDRLIGILRLAIVLLWTLMLLGCRQGMYDDPARETFEVSSVFADGTSARPKIPGTVAQGDLDLPPRQRTGVTAGGAWVDDIPLEVSRELLERGRQRYDIYCAPCHDRTGQGQGLIVLRGFPAPPTLHQDRLRAAPAGYFFDVITNGYGVMYSYRDRITPTDRWAIIGWIRVLQLSQHIPADDLPAADQERLPAP